MALHAVATHLKYGIQRLPWQRHELSSVISLSFLDVYVVHSVEKIHKHVYHFLNNKTWLRANILRLILKNFY